METLTVEISKEKLDIVPEESVRQVLIDIGIWDATDDRDPMRDIAAAWVIVKKITKNRGQGIELSMGVTDALNDYGRLENWYAIYQEHQETCELCETKPEHYGNHRYRREWVPKCYAKAFTVEEAICRLALKYIFENPYG